MHLYEQRVGRLWLDAKVAVSAYSGHGDGRNNPLLQNVPRIGPIPVGAWLLGELDESGKHGPFAIHLVHLAGQVFGRDGFLVHGDSKEHPGEASLGCIITDRATREKLYASRDRLLVVLPQLPVPEVS